MSFFWWVWLQPRYSGQYPALQRGLCFLGDCRSSAEPAGAGCAAQLAQILQMSREAKYSPAPGPAPRARQSRRLVLWARGAGGCQGLPLGAKDGRCPRRQGCRQPSARFS